MIRKIDQVAGGRAGTGWPAPSGRSRKCTCRTEVPDVAELAGLDLPAGRRSLSEVVAGSRRQANDQTRSTRHSRAFSVHRSLYRYAGYVGHFAVDVHDDRHAYDMVSRPNKRAPTRRSARSCRYQCGSFQVRRSV